MKRYLLITVFWTFFIGGCGQLGPLYLPEDEPPSAQPDTKARPEKKRQPPAERVEPEPGPQSEPQTDLYYPY